MMNCRKSPVIRISRLHVLILLTSCMLAFNMKPATAGILKKSVPANYEVRQAIEVESLFPMFFWGGYHLGIGYRMNKFRVRLSVINGGSYNVDQQARGKIPEGYQRYYTTSPGLFFGYNLWRNLEIYSYYEIHKFKVEQMASKEIQFIHSNDFGIGLSYQFFLGKRFYIQPGIHSYFRKEQNLTYLNGDRYAIPILELAPIVRIGFRLWSRF